MKKILLFVLILCFAASVFTVSAATFEDMPNDWSTNALQHAVANGLLQGTDNKLLPKDKLTRAQMATILVRALGATEKGDISAFSDVKTTSWYYDSMAISYKMGIFRGDGAGKMNPDNAITRQEAFVVLSRAFSLSSSTTSGLNKFTDSADVASWAKEGIEALVINGYVGGSNGKLNPNANITRAEFAQVMYNLVKTYGNVAEDIPTAGTVIGNVIVRGNITKLSDLNVEGDLIIGDGVPSNFSLENVNVSGRIVIRAKGDFSYDGTAGELVLASENSSIIISADSTVSKITIVSNTSSFETLTNGSSTPSKPSIPSKPVTPTNPDPAEDIWTNFH